MKTRAAIAWEPNRPLEIGASRSLSPATPLLP